MIEALRSDIRGHAIDPACPQLARYLMASMGSLPIEVLRVIFLDAGRRVIADEQLQSGTLSQLVLFPRTIFRRAMELDAAAVLLVHNHPSGDPSPSQDDVDATMRLMEIGGALDIDVLDHIVVSASGCRHVMKARGRRPQRGPSKLVLRSSQPCPESNALANARRTVHRRMLRRQLVGADELFGEAAWDMLLDLFIQQAEGHPLSISSLCVTSGIPMSSALRLTQRMCDAGLIRRIPDPLDGRRSFLELGPETSHRLCAFFSEGAE